LDLFVADFTYSHSKIDQDTLKTAFRRAIMASRPCPAQLFLRLYWACFSLEKWLKFKFTAMDIVEIEKQLSKFIYELENEDRLVRVGLKDKLESSKIYKKYKKLFNKEILAEIWDKIKKAKGENKEILERTYFAIASSVIGFETSEREDRIKTYFASAKVKVGNEIVHYFELGPKISKEPIFVKREEYDKVATGVVEKINSREKELLLAEIALLKKLGFSGYIDYFSVAKKFDYGNFYKIVTKLIRATDKIWYTTIGQVSEEVFLRPFNKILSCHMSYLRSLSMFDSFYPSAKVVSTFADNCKALGLSDLLNQIKIDEADRPKKNPRAVCYWPDPPKEVHLVIKPIGGEQDFEAMLHEGGHALHGASVSPSLPFAFRVLSRSNALTEAYAFVLEDLVFNPHWLTKYMNVSAHSGAKIQKQAYFVNLMMLRRYLAKYTYEYELFSSKVFSSGSKLYKNNMDRITGFVHKEINWLADMDGGFYSAEYLRAWLGAAQIKHYLEKKFGVKWFLEARAGQFLRELYEDGVKYELEEVVSKLGYKPFDVSYLLDSYKKVLV